MLDKFASITCFVFDVDGVLTDSTVLVLENGLQARRMNIKDGFALQLAQKKGYHIRIISGGQSEEVRNRLEKLGVTDVHMAVADKKMLLEDFMIEKGLKREQVLYMGDDLPDLPAMKVVGLPCCPADAVAEIREHAIYISTYRGGEACVRDVIEKVMRLRGDWEYTTEVKSS